MGKRKHEVKRITTDELAEYFKVHRNTMRAHIKQYGELDKTDIYSILDFIVWYAIVQKEGDNAQ